MIHSFGKRRTIRARAEKEARKRQETRDAILWEVFPATRTCSIKIQGSDQRITAYYPENWTSTPRWLKPGNAVRVLHAGGKRNRIEIVGDGGTVPTPIPGGSSSPVMGAGANAILSGLNVVANGGMYVTIKSGTYRINDTTYSVTLANIMGTNPVQVMGVAPVMLMGAGGRSIVVPAAHATMFRMDAIVIGTDGTIDYLTGTPSATNPLAPETTAAHVLIATILVPPASTDIKQWYINAAWVAPFVSQMTAIPTEDRLDWSTGSTTIAVRILDQYGALITGRWNVVAAIETGGTGTVTSSAFTTTGTCTLTYQRMTDYDVYPYPGEHCPVFITIRLVEDVDIVMMAALLLEDEFGVPIV